MYNKIKMLQPKIQFITQQVNRPQNQFLVLKENS